MDIYVNTKVHKRQITFLKNFKKLVFFYFNIYDSFIYHGFMD